MMRKGNKKIFVIAAVFVVVVAAIIVAIFCSGSGKSKDLSGLDLGAKYLDEMDYDKALAAFESVLDIDPKNVEAYLGIVEVYIRQKEYAKALEVAKEGYSKTRDERLNEKITMIQSGNIFTSDNRMMRETCYDSDGQILWYHDFTYEKGTENHLVEAFDGKGVKINQAEFVYGENMGIMLRSYSWRTNDGALNQRVAVYDDGLKVSETEYDIDGVTVDSVMVFEYNEVGQCIKETRTGRDGYVQETTFEYDAEGREVRFDTFSDGQLTYYSIFTYHENGCMKTQEMYDPDGTMNGYSEHVYDENWNNIGLRNYDANGNLEYETKFN